MGKCGKHRKAGSRIKIPAVENSRMRYVQVSLAAAISHMFQNFQPYQKIKCEEGFKAEPERCVYSQNQIFSKLKFNKNKTESKENDI
jgi:hypothetical protein